MGANNSQHQNQTTSVWQRLSDTYTRWGNNIERIFGNPGPARRNRRVTAAVPTGKYSIRQNSPDKEKSRESVKHERQKYQKRSRSSEGKLLNRKHVTDGETILGGTKSKNKAGYSPTREPGLGIPDQDRIRLSTCTILFLGLRGAGKTSTSSAPSVDPSSNNNEPSFILHKANTTRNCGGFCFIECPGLGKGSTLYDDALLVSCLSKLIDETCPNRIPNLVCIVARFDDNRFEGAQSDFSRMLQTLAHVRNSWSDKLLSNIVLVLTHASKAGLQEQSDFDFKIRGFKETVKMVFPKAGPVSAVLIDNKVKAQPHSAGYMANLSAIMEKRQDVALKSVLDELENKGSTISYTSERIPAYQHAPYSKKKVEQIAVSMKSGHLLNTTTTTDDSSSDEESNWKSGYKPYLFPPDQIPQRKGQPHPNTSTTTTTCLDPNATLLLVDKSPVHINRISAGDKLLSKSMKTCIVTNITYKQRPSWMKVLPKIYYAKFIQGQHYILKYRHGKMRSEPLTAEKQLNDNAGGLDYYYVVEVDQDEGSFITGEGIVVCPCLQ